MSQDPLRLYIASCLISLSPVLLYLWYVKLYSKLEQADAYLDRFRGSRDAYSFPFRNHEAGGRHHYDIGSRALLRAA